MTELERKRRVAVRALVTEATAMTALVELFSHMLAEARSDPELGEAVVQFFGVRCLEDVEFEMRVQPVDGR